MRRKILMGVVGVAIFLFGTVAGVVGVGISSAAPGVPAAGKQAYDSMHTTAEKVPASSHNYCQTYVQQLAKDLNVTPAQLNSANLDAAQATLNQMHADGQITAQEETQLEQLFQPLTTDPCTNIDQVAQRAAQEISSNAGLNNARTSLQSAVAKSLHLSTSQLTADLNNGQTISQIASAQHVNLNDVNNAYLSTAKSQLRSAVSSGAITQAQANGMYTLAQAAVANGTYPLVQNPDMRALGTQAGGTGSNAYTALMSVRSAAVNAVATQLGISASALRSDLQQGQTIQQLAQARHVPLSSVNSAYLNATKSALGRETNSGTITQAQAKAIYNTVQTAANNGYYLLLNTI